MLRVTEAAKKELKRMLAEKVDNPLAGLRLVRSGQPDNFGLGHRHRDAWRPSSGT